jgi:hypothetical protein
MDDDGPILVPTLMNEEPAFLVIMGDKDFSLRQMLTVMLALMLWFVFGWMALGAIFGNGPLGLLGFIPIPVMGCYMALRRKGDERMTYEEWLACRINYFISPRYYIREDQDAGGAPDMETLVWEG